MTFVEEGANEIGLGWKVPVKRHLSHAALGNDAVYADRAHALGVKQRSAVSRMRWRAPRRDEVWRGREAVAAWPSRHEP